MSTILIVDGDTSFRKSLERLILGRFGQVRIVVLEICRKAEQVVATSRVRLAIINLHIANGQGLALAIRLKRKYPLVYVLLLADYDLPEYRRAARQAGADGFMSKERCDGDRVIRHVKRALADTG